MTTTPKKKATIASPQAEQRELADRVIAILRDEGHAVNRLRRIYEIDPVTPNDWKHVKRALAY